MSVFCEPTIRCVCLRLSCRDLCGPPAEAPGLALCGFLLSLCTLLALLVLYWLALNMFTLLAALALPALAALASGHALFSALHAAGVKAKKE